MKTVFDCPWRHRCCCLFNRNTPNTVVLTHWGRVTHICVSKLTIIGSDNGLSPGRHHHYLNQCWNIVNSNLTNKLQWNLKRNSCIFIHENGFENVVCEMASILSRPPCVTNATIRAYMWNRILCICFCSQYCTLSWWEILCREGTTR